MVLVPFATNKQGELTHIDEAKPSVAHSCPGCERRVFPRFSVKRANCFYHRDPGGCSDGQTARHKSAIQMIIKGFVDAKAVGRAYEANVVCAWCTENEVEVDLCAISDSIISEKQTVDTYLPDISLMLNSKVAIAIEVVVSSEMKPEKIRKYKELSISVLIVRPTPSSLFTLDKYIVAPESLLVMCGSCKDRLDVWKRYPATFGWEPGEIEEAIRTGYYFVRNLPPPSVEPDASMEPEVEPIQTGVAEFEPALVTETTHEPVTDEVAIEPEADQLEMHLEYSPDKGEELPVVQQPSIIDQLFSLWLGAKIVSSSKNQSNVRAKSSFNRTRSAGNRTNSNPKSGSRFSSRRGAKRKGSFNGKRK